MLNPILFIFSARNEQMIHTYHGDVKVEMQQFDKHGYCLCNIMSVNLVLTVSSLNGAFSKSLGNSKPWDVR